MYIIKRLPLGNDSISHHEETSYHCKQLKCTEQIIHVKVTVDLRSKIGNKYSKYPLKNGCKTQGVLLDDLNLIRIQRGSQRNTKSKHIANCSNNDTYRVAIDHS